MKFLCDDNLGKLAKYLRMLGLDTFFRSDIRDAELLGVMLKQNRIVLECNVLCDDVTKDDIIDEVFPYIIKTQDNFKRCPSCRRIYWQGSHYKDMVGKLADVIRNIR